MQYLIHVGIYLSSSLQYDVTNTNITILGPGNQSGYLALSRSVVGSRVCSHWKPIIMQKKREIIGVFGVLKPLRNGTKIFHIRVHIVQDVG